MAEPADPIDLVIDCDPGVDDALALWLAAAHPERLRLLGVTCVTGNRPVAVTAPNARRLLDTAERTDVPVYAGAAWPIGQTEARSNLVHGEDGLGGVVLTQQLPVEQEPAVDFLVRTLCDAPLHSITLAAVGPLTNLALAERQCPGVLSRAKELLVMGGALHHPGNVSPVAEFNVWADPVAARSVLAARPAELHPLDVTAQVSMSRAWLDDLGKLPGRCAQAAWAMVGAYMAHDVWLHDACPIARLLEPALFSGERWALDVATAPDDHEGALRGQPLADPDAPLAAGQCVVMLRVDAPRVLALVSSALGRLP
jgi:purine nucleosidase